MRDPEPTALRLLSRDSPEQAVRLPRRPTLLRSDSAPAASTSRLAAVLAADVAEYSRHMSEDEAGTHALFTELFRTLIEPALAEHGARVVKNTGDGFLAEFWSATRAVRCALAFQSHICAWNRGRRRNRKLEFRVGINVGDIIVEPHDIFGHNVNVAARLEGLADPGGVLVSHAVFASVRDRTLVFQDVGELALKNMTETVRGFRVASLSGRE